MSEKAYRLITRADFDGVVSGSLLAEKGMIREVLFAHPRDVQDGKVSVSGDDMIANLPYVESAHICFDHHVSESYRVEGAPDNLILNVHAPSTARVIYEHFGGRNTFSQIDTNLLGAVDKADAAEYTIEDVLTPEGWTLVNFILDPRTGLEEFGDFSLSREEFMAEIMQFCRRNPVEEILAHPDVVDRIEAYRFNNEFAELQIERCAELRGKTVFVNYRKEEKRFPGNRFMVYGLFPDCDMSVKVQPLAEDGDMIEIAVGKSIIDRSCPVNVGELMLRHGGGHDGAGTCRAPLVDADDLVKNIIETIEHAR